MDKIWSERGERKEREDGLIALLWHGSTGWSYAWLPCFVLPVVLLMGI
jgi:hypothetical protein